MKRSHTMMLRMLFWALNIVIAGVILLLVYPVFLVFNSAHHGPLWQDSSKMELLTVFLRTLYYGGLIYILVLLNKTIFRILKGHTYDNLNLRYMRRIGYLLLLAPVPSLLSALLLIAGSKMMGGMGVMMFLDGILNYWPYCLLGLGILVLAAVYKKGIAYRQELDLTV
jgi:hypothetical protein